jgi:TatD DNase family protein
MNYIDLHTHIDFYKNPNTIYNEYEKLKIYTLFMTNLPEIFDLHKKKFDEKKYVRISLGYHPSLVNSYEFNKELFMKCSKLTNYIGEIGINYNKNTQFLKKQVDIFEFIIKNTTNKIYSIHSHKTEELILDILQQYNVKNAVFHWFSGNMKNLYHAVELGYYFSINNSMLASENGKKIIASIPKDRLLFETDAPFTKIKNKYIHPKDIPLAYMELQDFLKLENIQQLIFTNFRKLLNSRLDSILNSKM